MNAADMPQITGASYGSLTTNAIDFAAFEPAEQPLARMARPLLWQQAQQTQEIESTPMANSSRRIVQVFVADPHPDVPLDKALLHQGEPKFTDANDQELYFELELPKVLAAHNEQRVKWLDKDASKRAGKDIFLEPIKLRDLRMVVVTVAQF